MPSDIFHYHGLSLWSPLAEHRLERVLDQMPLDAGGCVVDIGCGRGDVLLRLARRHSVRAVGVDRSQAALDLCRTAFADARLDGALTTWHGDARHYRAEPGSCAAVITLGGPHLADDLASSWQHLAGWLQPGGYLLVGEGFWQCPPAPAYLEATGISAESMRTHWQNIELGLNLGLSLYDCCTSSRAEWDHFEGRIMANIERYVARHPEDTAFAAQADQRRAFYLAQQRWGRSTMGFGIYLFRAR